MPELKKIAKVSDFFLSLSDREEKGVFFYRVSGYNAGIHAFIRKYYEACMISGVIVEGGIPNPDQKNLTYYNEIMGSAFEMNSNFIYKSINKWLPRLNLNQKKSISDSIYNLLLSLQKIGKNVNMLKNIYIKFMCWLYYKFERILIKLGDEKVPKMLIEGDISNYALMLVSVLSNAGCDVVLLLYKGDSAYLKIDPKSEYSNDLVAKGMNPFPANFSLKIIRDEMKQEKMGERLYGKKPDFANCTNTWTIDCDLTDIKKPSNGRGYEQNLFYNCFLRVRGVQEQGTYSTDLLNLKTSLEAVGRKIVIVEDQIPNPTPPEISTIKRKNYPSVEHLVLDLYSNLKYPPNLELQKWIIKSFVDILTEESKVEGMNISKLTNKAIFLLCWFKRYILQILPTWSMPNISCFVHMGPCKNENEAFFLRFLARLPIDVVILVPNLEDICCLSDPILIEKKYSYSLAVKQFPKSSSDVRVATYAYSAEKELDSVLTPVKYGEEECTGANTVTLSTTSGEILSIWKEGFDERPNFSIVGNTANISVLFSKISGVKDRNVQEYWNYVREFVDDETFLITEAPFIKSTVMNPIKASATSFLKSGQLLRDKIKSHYGYRYGFLKNELQEYMLDKIQLLLNDRLIRGTFQNGIEYNVVATALNMPRDVLRAIQQFEFKKKSPKFVYVNVREKMPSVEDAIMCAFLSYMAFDIIFFVPTGYQAVEQYFSKDIVDEHQIGEFIYDMQVPNLRVKPKNLLNSIKESIRNRIFKRNR